MWILGAGCDFWKLERKAEQATERSGVGCGAWSGGFQKSWQNSAGSGGHESIGLHGLLRGLGLVVVDDVRREVSERLVGPPGVVAVEPAFEAALQFSGRRVWIWSVVKARSESFSRH